MLNTKLVGCFLALLQLSLLNYFSSKKSLCVSAPGIFNYTAVQCVYGMLGYPELQGAVSFLGGIGIWKSGKEIV